MPEKFKEQVNGSLGKEFFDEVNDLLKKYGVDDVEVESVKLKLNRVDNITCPPGKTRFAYKTADGRTHYRCI